MKSLKIYVQSNMRLKGYKSTRYKGCWQAGGPGDPDITWWRLRVDAQRLICRSRLSTLNLGTFTAEREAQCPNPLHPHNQVVTEDHSCNTSMEDS